MDYHNDEARQELLKACPGGFFCYVALLFLVVIALDAIRSLHEQGWSLWLLLPGAAIVLSVIGLAAYSIWVLTRRLLRRR
jgi:hypothetical protein